MKIGFVISSLNAGGAEKVVSLMANYWAGIGHEIQILTFEGSGDRPFFPISEIVKIHRLDLMELSTNCIHGIGMNVFRIKTIRQNFFKTKPDVIISFVDRTNVLTIFAALGLGIPVIVSERTSPAQYFIGPGWSFLRRLLYKKADHIIVQSQEIFHYFKKTGLKKISVIPNPILKPKIQKGSETFFRIIGVGRLGREKGFDLLITAFAGIASKFPQWKLLIAGEGSERKNLEGLIQKFDSRDKIQLIGRHQDMTALYCQSDIFVLPSRFEGFPNGLLEAMSHGLPVIAGSCSPAIHEIIRHNENGVIIPPNDVAAMAQAIENLILYPEERAGLGKNALKVLERYSIDRIMPMWETLIKKVLKK